MDHIVRLLAGYSWWQLQLGLACASLRQKERHPQEIAEASLYHVFEHHFCEVTHIDFRDLRRRGRFRTHSGICICAESKVSKSLFAISTMAGSDSSIETSSKKMLTARMPIQLRKSVRSHRIPDILDKSPKPSTKERKGSRRRACASTSEYQCFRNFVVYLFTTKMLLSTLFIALLLKPAEAQCKTSPLWHDDPLNCGDDTVEANCSALFCQWDSITALCKPLTNGGQTDDCSTIQAKDQCDLQPACAFDEPGCSSYKIAKATKDSGFVECTLAPFMDSLTNLFASTSSNYQELTEQEIQIMTTNAICGCTPKYVGASTAVDKCKAYKSAIVDSYGCGPKWIAMCMWQHSHGGALTAVDDCKAYHSAIVQGCRAVLTGFKCGGDFCNVGVTTGL
eukprot:g38055.t1